VPSGLFKRNVWGEEMINWGMIQLIRELHLGNPLSILHLGINDAVSMKCGRRSSNAQNPLKKEETTDNPGAVTACPINTRKQKKTGLSSSSNLTLE